MKLEEKSDEQKQTNTAALLYSSDCDTNLRNYKVIQELHHVPYVSLRDNETGLANVLPLLIL